MTATPAAVALEPISLPESRALIALEKVIERGLETFVQVGEALAEIRDRKLFRTEHPTFAEYCKAKWKMSDRRARQLMDASEVVTAISKSGTIVPKTESQTRPLTTLPPAQRVEVWQKAVAASPNGEPTAAEVKAAVVKVEPGSPFFSLVELKGEPGSPFGLPCEPTAAEVKAVVETMNAKPPKTANVVGTRQTASEPDATKTPLQWLTHYWMEASEEDRRLFDNFRAGLRGGR
jgi:hypothetical protein